MGGEKTRGRFYLNKGADFIYRKNQGECQKLVYGQFNPPESIPEVRIIKFKVVVELFNTSIEVRVITFSVEITRSAASKQTPRRWNANYSDQKLAYRQFNHPESIPNVRIIKFKVVVELFNIGIQVTVNVWCRPEAR